MVCVCWLMRCVYRLFSGFMVGFCCFGFVGNDCGWLLRLLFSVLFLCCVIGDELCVWVLENLVCLMRWDCVFVSRVGLRFAIWWWW